jgi:D-beta-D-heptose 7-phosphate kinase/D-beta-D-heptose 1-phosphate adenosyltransferase
MNRQRYEEISAAFSNSRVLVIGDLILDQFVWGRVSRISPEAPVPVVEVDRETQYPGGAANVARNLREFTPHAAVLGIIGADSDRRRPAGPRLPHHHQDARHRPPPAARPRGPRDQASSDRGPI